MVPSDDLSQGGPTPLAILLQTMREKWLAGDRDGAAVLARAVAPYLHPRRASVSYPGTPTLETHHLSDAELAERLAHAETREGAPPENPDLPA